MDDAMSELFTMPRTTLDVDQIPEKTAQLAWQ
jgi:hypothetical protein